MSVDGVSPHSVEAERTVLGSVMLDSSCLSVPEVAELEAADFYSEKHQCLWAIISKIHDGGGEVHEMSVVDAVSSQGRAEACGGLSYVTMLTNDVPSVEIAGYSARQIRDHATRRRVATAGLEVHLAAKDKRLDVVELARIAEAPTEALRGRLTDGAWSSAQVLAFEVYEDVERRVQMGGGPAGLPVGPIAKLAALLPGQMWTLAARPGMGKTGFALNLMRQVVSHGHGAAFFSLEMPRDVLVRRIAADLADLGGTRVRDGQLNRSELARFRDACDYVSGLPFVVDDSGGLTPMDIRSRSFQAARRMEAAGTPLSLIIVDHLGHVRAKGQGRYEQMTDASHSMLALAKRMNACVLSLCQLNRGPDNRDDHRPRLSDLRDSGAIEEDSRGVLFLYRPGYYDSDSPRANFGEVLIAKQNDGPAGVSMWLDWHDNTGSWGDAEVPAMSLPADGSMLRGLG